MKHVLPSRVLGLVRPNWTTGFSRMAWKSGLSVSMPLSMSSGDGFLSPSSHSHCNRDEKWSKIKKRKEKSESHCLCDLWTYRSVLLVVVHPQSIHHLLLIKPHLHQCNDSLQWQNVVFVTEMISDKLRPHYISSSTEPGFKRNSH